MRFVAIALVLVAFAGCETVEEQVASPKRDCVRPEGVADISFSSTKYPNIRRHVRRAVRDGWPRVLVLRRGGADERRDDLLVAYPTRDGFDRDEYPPAVGRRRAAAHVAYVPQLARTDPTAPRWGSSCAGSATARASGTSSTERGIARRAIPLGVCPGGTYPRGLVDWGRGFRALSERRRRPDRRRRARRRADDDQDRDGQPGRHDGPDPQGRRRRRRHRARRRAARQGHRGAEDDRRRVADPGDRRHPLQPHAGAEGDRRRALTASA